MKPVGLGMGMIFYSAGVRLRRVPVGLEPGARALNDNIAVVNYVTELDKFSRKYGISANKIKKIEFDGFDDWDGLFFRIYEYIEMNELMFGIPYDVFMECNSCFNENTVFDKKDLYINNFDELKRVFDCYFKS